MYIFTCVVGCSFSKQLQRPTLGKDRLPGPGQYKMRGDLDPQALSTHSTSPRVSFPIAPKTQADKVRPHVFVHLIFKHVPLHNAFEALSNTSCSMHSLLGSFYTNRLCSAKPSLAQHSLSGLSSVDNDCTDSTVVLLLCGHLSPHFEQALSL